ncbi:MAG: esterase-like activity of phytase family protein, partial [Beijerinckiaceae bacterium]
MGFPLQRRQFLIGVGAAALAAPAITSSAFGKVPLITAPVDIAVTATPIPQFNASGSTQTQFGALQYRGGLELSAPHGAFGGLSGLAMDADGKGFLAITDVGSWFRATLNYDSAGRPARLTSTTLAPMLNANGIPLKRTKWYDTESLALSSGVAYVGIERQHDVFRFDYGRDGFQARGRPIAVPPNFKKMPNNKGCEALGVAPAASPLAGSLVGISERSHERDNFTLGFILTGAQRGEFRYVTRDGFDVTDLTFLPDGDMLVLERFYAPFRGVGMRIRRVDGKTIRPGATIEGALLINADLAFNIDNMEALSWHRAANGQIIL